MGIIAILKHRTASGLPDLCAYRHPQSGMTIIIRKGERCYHVAVKQVNPDAYNRKYGITLGQAEAMFNGAVLGWHRQEADPKNYDEKGRFIAKKSRAI